MAQITLPIKLDFNYVILDVLKSIEAERDDYMYMQGFYDCRDTMIAVIENFMEEHFQE